MENLESISATVESIDIEKRLVGLKGERGRTATVEVSPDVRNLAQVRVGDKVVVRYYESLAAEVKKKGTSATLNTVDDAAGAVRAAPGDKPGAAVGSVVSTTVVIQSVDTKANVVDFTGPGGMQRTVHVVKPEAQQFIAGLKKGDEVEMTYTEALAVSVETQ
jgi:Cu/Ag efflux protein CusF